MPDALDSVDAWNAAVCSPGAGAGTLARFGPVVLLAGSSDPAALAPLLDHARTVAANGGQGRQLVRGLALVLATSGDDVPPFAALAPHGTGLAIFVQGEATVTVGTERISGADSLAWIEKLLPWPLERVTASIDGQPEPAASAESGGLYRLDGGVVPAGSVTLRPGTPAEPAAAPAEPAAVPAEPAAVPAEPAAEPPPPWPEPAPEQPVVEVPEPTPPPTPAPPAAPPAEPAYPPAPPAEVPVADLPVAAPQAAPAGRPVPAPVADEHVNFDSVLLSDVDLDDEPAPLPIVSQASEVPDAQPQAAEVKGVFCKNRHFNDPRQLFCAVCGINMVQQTPVLVDGKRPPLGVVVLDDGSVYQLDTPYLLGRDPESDPRVDTGEFRGLPIIDQSNQVSRVHARLELRGWDVVLVDNSSTNGTFLHLPKTPDWQRLPPGGELVLLQGTRVRIGHRTLAFNTHSGPTS